MSTVLVAGGGALGLVVGSFLNVVVHRVPRGESIAGPPSACPSCGARIRKRDNVPIVSWLLLRGRCRDCGNRISPRYPVVEAVTGLAFAGIAWLIGTSWTLPAYWLAAATAIALAVVDLAEKRIPNRILFPGLLIGWGLLIGGALVDGEPGALLRAAAGAGIYFGILLVVALAARGGFGFGDVKLGLLLGTFLAYRSWGVLATGVFAGFAVGGLAGVALLIGRRVGRKDSIPFGPAMVIGAAVALVWGQAIADWYFGS